MPRAATTESADDTPADDEPLSIGNEVDLFEKNVSSISDVLPGMIAALEMVARTAHKELHTFEKTHSEVFDDEGGLTGHRMPLLAELIDIPESV